MRLELTFPLHAPQASLLFTAFSFQYPPDTAIPCPLSPYPHILTPASGSWHLLSHFPPLLPHLYYASLDPWARGHRSKLRPRCSCRPTGFFFRFGIALIAISPTWWLGLVPARAARRRLNAAEPRFDSRRRWSRILGGFFRFGGCTA